MIRSDTLKPKIIVICGSTASGKTATSIEVASAFSGEIVGADSVQIYRYMDIGTAKPSAQARSEVRYEGIDLVPPDHSFSTGDYVTRCAEALATSLDPTCIGRAKSAVSGSPAD